MHGALENGTKVDNPIHTMIQWDWLQHRGIKNLTPVLLEVFG